MVHGLVSNVWRTQLRAGADLFDLIAVAADQDFRVFELRQKSLGNYESPTNHLPDIASIALNTRNFSAFEFIASYEVPFLNPITTALHSNFIAATKLACAVAVNQQPHIRIVDLETTDQDLSVWSVLKVSAVIVALVRSVSKFDGILSLENASQSWGFLENAVTIARNKLGEDSHRLRICFDPANLALKRNTTELISVMESLSSEKLGMLHLKQRKQGIVDYQFREGDIDWKLLVSIAAQRNLLGRCLFEIAEHEDLWSNLDASSKYFKALFQ